MSPLRLLAAATPVALAVLLGGCVAATPSSSPVAGGPVSPVDGIIVAVDASGLSDVRGFTLRLVDGSTVAFHLGQLENPTQFPPGHLKEHEATSIPVRVFFVAGPNGPVVYRLEDAPVASPTAASPTAASPTASTAASPAVS